jgi:membrane protease YdiL (CAAX protease family)
MVFVLSWISKINNNHRLFNDEGGITQKTGNLLGIHVIGIIWLGLVPVIQLKHSVFEVLFGNGMPEILAFFFFLLIYLLTITIAHKQAPNINSTGILSNEIFGKLTPAFFKRYFIIRALYLFVYELWFRGFLLFESINLFGIPAAISINIFLYTLLHIFKSKKEILACIPFGLILCFLSIYFNAAWPAIILHIGFSLFFELNIYRNSINSTKIAAS